MIFPDINKLEIYLCVGAIDMRKSFNGLALIIETILKHNPCSRNLYVFCNRSRTTMKILYYDGNSFCIWQKKIKGEKFFWPSIESEITRVDSEQLYMMICGIDYSRMNKKYNFDTVMLK